ncbi:MAG TPA: dipeptide epimerase [Nitrolancea sp.]
MPSIVQASAELIDRASSSRLNTSYGASAASRAHVMVRLTDDEGRHGYGEASPLPSFTGETAASIQLQLRHEFLPALLGQSPFDLHAIHRTLGRLPENSSAKAAIDIALYDLMGKQAGLTVTQLLGGPVRPDVPVTFPLGIDEIDETVRKAVAQTERGIRTLKMKIGFDPDADVARVQAVRDAVGPDVAIRIDANQGYDVPSACRIVSRLAEVGIEYVEQPVAQWDFAGLAAVRRSTGMRVMVDESLHTLRDAQRLIELGAADIFAIKLIKTSGLTQARHICALAAAHRIDVVVISPFETQIGAAAGLALALSVPTATRAHELRVFDSQSDMAETGIRCERGRIAPSDAPGLGVTSISEFAGLTWNDVPAATEEHALV